MIYPCVISFELLLIFSPRLNTSVFLLESLKYLIFDLFLDFILSVSKLRNFCKLRFSIWLRIDLLKRINRSPKSFTLRFWLCDEFHNHITFTIGSSILVASSNTKNVCLQLVWFWAVHITFYCALFQILTPNYLDLGLVKSQFQWILWTWWFWFPSF